MTVRAAFLDDALTIVVINYQPSWLGRLFGRRTVERIARCRAGLWTWDHPAEFPLLDPELVGAIEHAQRIASVQRALDTRMN